MGSYKPLLVETKSMGNGLPECVLCSGLWTDRRSQMKNPDEVSPMKVPGKFRETTLPSLKDLTGGKTPCFVLQYCTSVPCYSAGK